MHTISITHYDATDPRLSRHVHHDSRSLDHLYLPRDAKPKGKNVTWNSEPCRLNQKATLVVVPEMLLRNF